MNRYQQTSQHIPLTGALLLVLLCLVWGGNLVSIKVSNQSVPPLLTAAIRSCVASFLLWIYAKVVREQVFLPTELVKHGVAIGLLFGAEFLLLYWGLNFTHASRAVLFLYTHPLWTALMAHFILTDDRLNLNKILGICLAFLGLTLVFGSRAEALGPVAWVGDLMELVAGFLWAATTIYIKRFIWNTPITHFQTLFAQLFFSIPLLILGSLGLEWGRQVSLDPLAVAAIFYQCVIVAFVSYLAWFRMIHLYPVSRLAAFTFLAPFFGVILSGLLLHEAITLFLWIGLGLVAAGIYLVNRPRASG
ncbi:MAG: DMT family transporter [Deltaproteobacteria bacterium]|nr:DMT family transporter [Deltaproteobacteria bacterium]